MGPPRSGWTTRTLPSEFVNSFIQCLRRSGQNCSLDLRMFIRVFGNGLVGCRRLGAFISTASAEDSFRSRCGSVRKAPVWSSHASPVAAPQVGQGTDNICFAVSSLVFIPKVCNVSPLLECSILLIFNLLAGQQFLLDSAGDSPQFCTKVNTFCDFNSGKMLGSVARRQENH
jgi:hypothetical protein